MEADGGHKNRHGDLPAAGYCSGTTSWTEINIFFLGATATGSIGYHILINRVKRLRSLGLIGSGQVNYVDV